MGRGRGRWLLCEREKRWKGLGEIVPTYIAIEEEKAGEVARISFFTTIMTTYG